MKKRKKNYKDTYRQSQPMKREMLYMIVRTVPPEPDQMGAGKRRGLFHQWFRPLTQSSSLWKLTECDVEDVKSMQVLF